MILNEINTFPIMRNKKIIPSLATLLLIDSVKGAGRDAIQIAYAEGNGIQINSAGLHGVHVSSAGLDGVVVSSAGGDGVLSLTPVEMEFLSLGQLSTV